MMEENNRKGPGIFYAVVGVATLVVAIIGATFAFFSAQATVEGDDITGTTATTGTYKLTVDKVLPTTATTPLIPLNSTKAIGETNYLGKALAKEKLCTDDNGDVVCHVYSFTINNGGSASLLTTTQLKLELTGTNTDATNWRWQLVEGNATDGFAVAAGSSAVTTVTTATNVGSDTLAATGAADNANEKTYYVVIWLNDPGDSQTETGVTFTGTVTSESMDAQGNKTGITATFEA